MKGLHRGIALLLLTSPGCLNFSYGSRNPTLAQEISELSKSHQRGTITAQEFETGKVTLLNHYRRGPATDSSLVGPHVATRRTWREQPSQVEVEDLDRVPAEVRHASADDSRDWVTVSSDPSS